LIMTKINQIKALKCKSNKLLTKSWPINKWKRNGKNLWVFTRSICKKCIPWINRVTLAEYLNASADWYLKALWSTSKANKRNSKKSNPLSIKFSISRTRNWLILHGSIHNHKNLNSESFCWTPIKTKRECTSKLWMKLKM
jgi:hypothetical protein